jgi:cytochrome c-type biogenesis protein CcmH
VPDQPLAGRQGLAELAAGARPSQAEAEAEMAGQPPPAAVDPQYAELVARLERTVAERPGDLEGHRLLANSLMQLGRFAEARRQYDRVIELSDGAAGAEVHAARAEAMNMAAGGYVSPEATDAIAAALERDPALPMARYYAGLALRQAGRLDDAVAMWQGLRRDSPPDAPYLAWVDTMLAEAEAARGGRPGAPSGDSSGVPSGPRSGASPETPADVPPGAPAAPPGPGQAETEAAARLPPEERAAMIEGMVARLEERLTTKGGTAEEWLRLIRSFVQLDRPEEAERAYRLAAAALAGDPAAGFVREQAMLMGVGVE